MLLLLFLLFSIVIVVPISVVVFCAFHVFSIWIRKNITQTKSIRRKRVDHITVFRLQNGQIKPKIYIHLIANVHVIWLRFVRSYLLIFCSNMLQLEKSSCFFRHVFSYILNTRCLLVHMTIIWLDYSLYFFFASCLLYILSSSAKRWIHICIYLECGRTAPWYKKAAVQRQ